jgi:hypothetical protein
MLRPSTMPQAAALQRLAVFVGVAGRGGDELHALVGHEGDDVGIAHEGLGDVDAPRLVGEAAHLSHLLAHLVEAPGRGLDDPQAAGVGDGAGQLGPCDPAHGRLDDRVLNPQQLGDAVLHGRSA